MDLKLYRYRFPFKKSFRTGSGSYRERKGVLFILQSNDITAYGEAAPLPGFSHESLEDTLNYISNHYSAICAFIEEQINSHEQYQPVTDRRMPASLAFALDTLLFDYHAKQEKKSLLTSIFLESRKEVKVNGTLPIGNVEDVMPQAKAMWENGYRTIKLKVGVNFEQEKNLIKQLRNQFPKLKIRIDANQSWTFDQAQQNLEQLTSSEIEYCEEPLAHPTPDQLKKLREQIAIPIALDESLYRQQNYKEWIRDGVAEFIIIKPMVLGGFIKNFATFRLADLHECTTIFTSALESGIGRMMTAALACRFGAPSFAHGLDTGRTLKVDVWHDQSYINNGFWRMPDRPGLGNEFNPESIDLALQSIDGHRAL